MKLTVPSTAAILAIFATIVVGGIMAGLFLKEVPGDNRDLVLQLGTQIVGGWGVAMAFYFGASKGGRDALQALSEREAGR